VGTECNSALSDHESIYCISERSGIRILKCRGFNVEPYRYEARMDLLNLYIETNQDAKAKEMANEIIKLRVKIPSAKIEEYKRVAKANLDSFTEK
jgi:hypothetical protein